MSSSHPEQGLRVSAAQNSRLYNPVKLGLNPFDSDPDVFTVAFKTLVYVLKQIAFRFQEGVVVDLLLDFEGRCEVLSQLDKVSHSTLVEVGRVALLEKRHETQQLLFVAFWKLEFGVNLRQVLDERLKPQVH